MQPFGDGTHLVEQRGELLIERRASLNALADETQSFAKQLDRGERVVERYGEARRPDAMRGERVGQAHDELTLFLQEDVEQVEQQCTLVAKPLHRGRQPRFYEVEARCAEQVAARGQSGGKGGEQTLAPAVEAIDETQQPAARDGCTEVRRGGILEMVPLVDDEPPIRGQHGRVVPVLRDPTHGQIGEQEVMVDDDDVRFRRCATSLEDKALVEMRALHARAQIALGRNFIPHFRARRRRQVGERSIRRSVRPCPQGRQFSRHAVVKQLRRAARGLFQAGQTQIVAPSLEQREAHPLIAKCSREKRQILADELFLQVDRVRGDDGPFPVRRRPAQRRHEVPERLADTGARLQQPDAAVVVDSRDGRRHVALARAIFVARMLQRDSSAGSKVVRDGSRIDPLPCVGAWHFDDDVERARLVVDDAESDAIVVHAHRDVVVGTRRLEQSGRMVVQQHLASAGEAGECQNARDVATCHHARGLYRALFVERGDEAHFATAREADGCTHGGRRGRCDTRHDGGLGGGSRHP